MTTEDVVISYLDDGESAAEFVERMRWSIKPSTVARYLKAAFDNGVLDRRWEGNERYGRFVYFRKAE